MKAPGHKACGKIWVCRGSANTNGLHGPFALGAVVVSQARDAHPRGALARFHGGPAGGHRLRPDAAGRGIQCLKDVVHLRLDDVDHAVVAEDRVRSVEQEQVGEAVGGQSQIGARALRPRLLELQAVTAADVHVDDGAGHGVEAGGVDDGVEGHGLPAHVDAGLGDVERLAVAALRPGDRVEDARNVLKEGDEVTAVVVNIDRKTRNIQLSIKAKDMADQNEAMQSLSQQSARENAGTTSLGALLRAKLDNNN